ncbi:MAG: hypothetical protein KGP35_03810 [Bacteroidetes bacterium]|nr:hypothetical protein [Bacteroidota bacterium]
MDLTIEDSLRLSSFLPVLLYFPFKKEKNIAKQVLFLFYAFVTIHSLLYALITFYFKEYSLIFNSFYIPIEFLLISYFFLKAVQNSVYQNFIKLISFLFIGVFITKSILFPSNDFDSIINGIESIIIIFFSISFFYETLKSPDRIFIDKDPFFWGISGFFLFFSISFFVFLLRQTYWDRPDFFFQYIYIHALSGILRNVICSIALLIKPYKEKVPDFA